MTDAHTFQIGMDGFMWFMGVIENMEDPLNIGRAKVRIIGRHEGDTEKLSTADLPWAYPIAPVTHARNMPNYHCGDWVFGFFLDGEFAQQPMILGVLPAITQAQT
jgi:Gp5 N-terminal OB domain